MIICVKCKKEMRCVKTGIGADYSNGHVYAGDKFRCISCGIEIISTNAAPHHDPNYTFHTEYLKMFNNVKFKII